MSVVKAKMAIKGKMFEAIINLSKDEIERLVREGTVVVSAHRGNLPTEIELTAEGERKFAEAFQKLLDEDVNGQ